MAAAAVVGSVASPVELRQVKLVLNENLIDDDAMLLISLCDRFRMSNDGLN